MNLILFTFIVLLGFTSYYFGRKKAYTIQSTKKRLTALPQFYGYYLAIWCAIPAFIIFSLWAIFEPTIVKLLILSDYSNQGYLDDELNLLYEKSKALSRGQFTGEITPFIEASAEKYLSLRSIAQSSKVVIVLSAIIASVAYAYKRISSNSRTREPVEKILKIKIVKNKSAIKIALRPYKRNRCSALYLLFNNCSLFLFIFFSIFFNYSQGHNI